MARMTMPAPADMTDEQRAVHDEAAGGKRGHAPAPLNAWIHAPEFARRAQKLGELLRYDTTLPPRLSELAILVTARHWTAHYEWKAHKPHALAGGLDPAIIAAIATRAEPSFTAPDERIVYAVATSLLRTQAVPDPLYAEALDILGERALVELVGVLGYYALVSMTLNTFQIGMPGALQADLA
jgi:4-carboxymuconolactone decarboxylase